MSEPVVSLRSVSFSYPDGHAALESVSLDVYPGESVAIIGPNGAGKSTLLQVIAGLVPATDGTVRVCGKEIDRRSIDRPHDLDWLRVKLGIVFQDSDVALFSSSVWNDVTFGPLHMGLSLDWLYTTADAAFSRGAVTAQVRGMVHRIFHQFESGSIQQIIYQMATAMLAEIPQIAEVNLEAQNRTWDFVAESGETLGVYTDARPPVGCLGLSLRR